MNLFLGFLDFFMTFVAIAWKMILEVMYDPIIFMQVGVRLTGCTKHTILNQTQTYLLPMCLWVGILKI